MRARHKHRIFWAVACASFALDQITKLAAQRALVVGGVPRGKLTVLRRVLSFKYGWNTGGPFSLFFGQNHLLILFSVLAAAAVIAWFLMLKDVSRLQVVALALVAGGALGNLCDRVFLGKVRDFVNLELIHTVTGYQWPIFNVADVSICLGVGLMVVVLLGPSKASRPDQAGASS